ncbi:nicotinate phosphoribosyltransferase [Shinella zoogloeoides]|uniref:nicotinate phosphoribosyltransferase n=1 Tax=Shinella zoogloeoides TaxID=352475 RepID=UPI00273CF555|nr:nicotinate phosphoribosyltransferase [Shinella zoogloeoides]WLR90923.1 nicotinate phosphoribosyltransferase [Shinella zoogloeoides]
MTNILLATDSYKHSHYLQYPPGTLYVSSYIEARGDAKKDGKVVFFGVQSFIQDYLSKPFTQADIDEAEELITAHGLPFNREGWEYILNRHNGYLPIEIEALGEGTVVERGIPLVQVRNTDPLVPWLTSFIETALLRAVWYGTSVATLSFAAKVVIYDALVASSDNPEAGLPFKLHDFGGRGASSGESAGLGGMAHLVNFQGTDTIEALVAVRRVYDDKKVVAGFSLPASEHSTMTSWSRAGEGDAYANMIAKFGGGLFSIVSDSYDLFAALEDIYGTALKDDILKIDGKLIVRPDSGDPVATPIKVLEALWRKFGGTVNSKGFKVLHEKIGVIQGDGMNFESISRLCRTLITNGWSLDNIAFGMGGGLLQAHKRDDLNFAMKCNAIDVGNGWQDVQKKPATDPAKASKAGRQAVVGTMESGFTAMKDDDEPEVAFHNRFETRYANGTIWPANFAEVRARAHKGMLLTHQELSALREAA